MFVYVEKSMSLKFSKIEHVVWEAWEPRIWVDDACNSMSCRIDWDWSWAGVCALSQHNEQDTHNLDVLNREARRMYRIMIKQYYWLSCAEYAFWLQVFLSVGLSHVVVVFVAVVESLVRKIMWENLVVVVQVVKVVHSSSTSCYIYSGQQEQLLITTTLNVNSYRS